MDIILSIIINQDKNGVIKKIPYRASQRLEHYKNFFPGMQIPITLKDGTQMDFEITEVENLKRSGVQILRLDNSDQSLAKTLVEDSVLVWFCD